MTRLSDYIGNWYAIPLPSGGWASVLVARASRRGVLLGYFFGPRSAETPDLPRLAGLRPEAAVRVGRFGDPGITDGEWPWIGEQPDWDSHEWPMPVLVHQDPLRPTLWYTSAYPDDDPNGIPSVAKVDAVAAADLPDNGMMGHVYVQELLDSALGQS